jgi:2-oxoglutarate ferredoxin oxidoreductase subunit alpha
MSTGLEHDELGRRTEERGMRVKQVDKRSQKVVSAREQESLEYREFGNPDAETLVITWGSNEGALVEALDTLKTDGIDVRVISTPYVYPRPDITDEVAAAEQVIVVECNATGQFADLVEHDTLTRVERINKYDGVRFKAGELAEEIGRTLDADPLEANQ